MRKDYLIAGLIIALILAVGVYFQIQDNAKINENLPSMAGQNIMGDLQTEILQEGNGPEAKSGDQVAVNYIGKLEDGTTFDENISTSTPFTFTLGAGMVIPGWEQGILGMKIGEKRKLVIPPNLAYGARGVSGIIPPNATLIFEVTLLSIDAQ